MKLSLESFRLSKKLKKLFEKKYTFADMLPWQVSLCFVFLMSSYAWSNSVGVMIFVVLLLGLPLLKEWFQSKFTHTYYVRYSYGLKNEYEGSARFDTNCSLNSEQIKRVVVELWGGEILPYLKIERWDRIK